MCLSSYALGVNVEQGLSSPVVLLFFNRPALTEKVFGSIRNARPQKLFLVSDGARPAIAGESDRVSACREIVAQIDWPCEVFLNYSDENLGCRKRVISGLDWVFSQVDRAIILEDDCLPGHDFFRFTDQLLEYYESDSRIGLISGTNSLGSPPGVASSYFFSKRPGIWGWATWSRVWREYDGDISDWPSQRKFKLLSENLHTRPARRYWKYALNGVYKEVIDTWDIQLTYHLFKTGQVSVIPSRNLVSNIGFGPDATHTKDSKSDLANLATFDIDFPLVHPSTHETHLPYDKEQDIRFAPTLFDLLVGEIARRLHPRVYSFARAIYNRLRVRL